MLALTSRCSRYFGVACWPLEQNVVCSISCLNNYGRVDGSRHEGSNELTPPMYWQLFERCVGSNVWERRCVMRSMSWQKSPQTGFWSTWTLSGQSGIASGSAIFVCPKMPGNG